MHPPSLYSTFTLSAETLEKGLPHLRPGVVRTGEYEGADGGYITIYTALDGLPTGTLQFSRTLTR